MTLLKNNLSILHP